MFTLVTYITLVSLKSLIFSNFDVNGSFLLIVPFGPLVNLIYFDQIGHFGLIGPFGHLIYLSNFGHFDHFGNFGHCVYFGHFGCFGIIGSSGHFNHFVYLLFTSFSLFT